MAHPFARRRGDSGDVANDRLGDMIGNELGRIFFGRTTDFTHHDDALGIRVFLEQAQAINEVHPVDRVSADPDAGRLAKACLSGLENRFIGQGSRTRHDTDLAWFVNPTRHDTDLALSRSDDARTVGADQGHIVVTFQGLP